MNQLDVADFPHLDAKGRDATIQRLWRRAGLADEAAGDAENGQRYDEHGRIIVTSGDELFGWARSAGLTGVAAA